MTEQGSCSICLPAMDPSVIWLVKDCFLNNYEEGGKKPFRLFDVMSVSDHFRIYRSTEQFQSPFVPRIVTFQHAPLFQFINQFIHLIACF